MKSSDSDSKDPFEKIKTNNKTHIVHGVKFWSRGSK